MGKAGGGERAYCLWGWEVRVWVCGFGQNPMI